MIFLDTETCGFTGPIIVIQYAYDDGNITLHEVWNEPVKKTLELIEKLSTHSGGICAFNLNFDWFHIVKLYNLFRAIENKSLSPSINEVSSLKQRECTSYCCKPIGCLDLLLYLRKSSYQYLMTRGEIRIRKVPIDLAEKFVNLLHKKLDFQQYPLLFHKKQAGYIWDIQSDYNGFADIVTRFSPSMQLKPFCSEVFRSNFSDFPMSKEFFPIESDYNPYTTDWKDVISYHISFWQYNKDARGYAEQDVILLQRLWHWLVEPPVGDIDSELAACTGAVRWKGFAVDLKKIAIRYTEKKKLADSCPININSSQESLNYLRQPASLLERTIINSTDKETLNELCTWDNEVGQRAISLQVARRAKKECLTLLRLFETERFCPNFNVLGTKSGRMSGGSPESSLESLNPQGMQRSFRELFTLADNGEILSGGDFSSFEVVIAQAASQDPILYEDLKSGLSFHKVFGSYLYDKPELSVEEYHNAKSGTFGIFYGAFPDTIAKTCNISIDIASKGIKKLFARYRKFAEFRINIASMFGSMIQPSGIGTPIFWQNTPEYVESLLGFRRYFNLENYIGKTLYDLANDYHKLPQSFGYVQRRKRSQTKTGALQSAIYSCIFQMQARTIRVALNHIIQSTGAEITKGLQLAIWHSQPVGINPWVIAPFNEHDEVMCVHSDVSLKYIVDEVVEQYQKVVPLLNIVWKDGMKNWSEK